MEVEEKKIYNKNISKSTEIVYLTNSNYGVILIGSIIYIDIVCFFLNLFVYIRYI